MQNNHPDPAAMRTVPQPDTPKPKRAKPSQYIDPMSDANWKVLELMTRKLGKAALDAEAIESKVRQLIGELNASRLLGQPVEVRRAFFDDIKDQLKASELKLLSKSILFKDIV